MSHTPSIAIGTSDRKQNAVDEVEHTKEIATTTHRLLFPWPHDGNDEIGADEEEYAHLMQVIQKGDAKSALEKQLLVWQQRHVEMNNQEEGGDDEEDQYLQQVRQEVKSRLQGL
jgi:hypothetical protein